MDREYPDDVYPNLDYVLRNAAKIAIRFFHQAGVTIRIDGRNGEGWQTPTALKSQLETVVMYCNIEQELGNCAITAATTGWVATFN